MPVRVVVVRIVDVGGPNLLPPPVNRLRGVGHDAVVDIGDRLRQLNPGVHAVDVFQDKPQGDPEMVAPGVEGEPGPPGEPGSGPVGPPGNSP